MRGRRPSPETLSPASDRTIETDITGIISNTIAGRQESLMNFYQT